MQRPFAGQMTAAGRINPAKVLVVGAGVAGLAAIQQAKNMAAVVNAFDVRTVAKEQVESMGAKFLEVPYKEDGSAAGGYAKEMSKEWHEAARQMLLQEMKTTNVIITTALIPGRKAPIMITKEMIAALPRGAITIDLAAEAGGNVETTVPNQVVQVGNATCVGFTNWPSQIANTASTLFGNNVTKFLLSMDKNKKWEVDLKDEAVRSMAVVVQGKKLEPYVPPPPAQSAATAQVDLNKPVAPPKDPEELAKEQAVVMTGGLATAVLLGSAVPSAGLLSTFALSVWVGSQAVRGVTHSLHSPLMSVTNAISGMTIVGGMLQLGGGLIPRTGPQILGAAAVALSSVNLAGGFLVTHKMLELFRRKDDPVEHFHYYLIPAGAVTATYAIIASAGIAPTGMEAMMALVSGLGCIGGISAMSKQSTARLAVFLSLGGVGMGIGTTLMSMHPDHATTFLQLAGLGALGGVAGQQVALRVGPTSLPQAVAGFHSLVGLAAAATAISDHMLHHDGATTLFHSTSVFLGAWLGAITCTGSVIASAKLAEVMDSKPLQLPFRDQINMGLAGGSALCLLSYYVSASPESAMMALGMGTLFSGALGLHMTASIGGADMPVVITLLNSYSGWALCAEGFILNQPLLTIVGALIGSSGAFLTKIMCDGMNRSLVSVMMGGFGTEAGAVQTIEGRVHTEIDAAGTAEALKNASRVVIVPGYGLAVAGAAREVAEIAAALVKEGKQVQFAVHPVAGRMPGQLNVLLAEAGVPYDIVCELEEVNEHMDQVDVCLVVGANDTVNSAAEEDPKSAIAGMPVIRVWKSKHVVFMKRSMASGYAGVDNPVFYKENTDMLLGNAKTTTEKILNLLR